MSYYGKEDKRSEHNLHMTSEVATRLWTYIDSVDTEIGGFGYVFRDDEKHQWSWEEIFLVDQEVSATEVVYSSDSLAQAVEKAMIDKVLNLDNFSWMMWHSHVDMGVGWSEKDDKDAVQRMRDTSGIGHLFSMVGNQSHDYKVRLDLFDHPIMPHIFFDNLKLTEQRDAELVTAARADIDKHVTKKKWQKAGKAVVTTTTKKEEPKQTQEYDDDEWLWKISQDQWDQMDWESVDEAIKDGRVKGPEDLVYLSDIKMFVPKQDTILPGEDEDEDNWVKRGLERLGGGGFHIEEEEDK